jgi:plastocyanin
MRTRLPALAACATLVALAGCGSSSSGSSSNSSSSTTSTAGKTNSSSLKVQVAYRNIAIAPDTFKVKVGSTIKWTNFDNVAHNVTSLDGPQKFASKDFNEDGTFEIKALKPGVIHYECTIHPASMNGTIEVVN